MRLYFTAILLWGVSGHDGQVVNGDELRVGDLGERALLELIAPFCGGHIGDDCALMGATRSGYELAVSTDMLVEGVHFSALTTSAYDVGWRGMTANLSDLAAMGAEPWGVTVALGLPADVAAGWVVEFYRGLRDCGSGWGVGVVGGDLVRSPVPTLGITAFGQVRHDRSIKRSQARVGDAIVVTGLHGLSRGGLELLLNPELGKLISDEEASFLCKAHQRPDPRLDVAQFLMDCTESLERTIAGMDSSDGLADAVLQICEASGVSAVIDWQKLTVHSAIRQLAGDVAMDWVLYGGEDFELVLCLPADVAELLTQAFPKCETIGQIVSLADPRQNLALLKKNLSFSHFS